MARPDKASSFWSVCETKVDGLLKRCERYAALTIPKVLLPDGFDKDNADQSHDYQSVGAQAVNHVVNKLMLALFAPSRPFIKLSVGKKTMEAALAQGITEIELNEILAKGERDAVAELDARAQRPKLYQLLRHLVITGNVLLVLGKDKMRIMGIKYFRVKRDAEGNLLQLVIKERVTFDELETPVQDILRGRYSEDDHVDHYRWIVRNANGSFAMSQWVNETRLPREFDGRWPADKLPYQVLCWDLADEADYGTGLVEEYIGDFESLSVLAESTTDGAVQGTEVRWLANPAGMTTVKDLQDSSNGDVLPGTPDDVKGITVGNSESVKMAMMVGEVYERRISRGFLMGSAVIRDAERVTQEEVRLTANELETAFGGVYSTLAASLQLPVARWLFAAVGMPLAGTDLRVTIVTGLDALSRNGDLDNFRLAMGDLATIESVPETMKERLNMNAIATFIGQGRGVDMSKFLLTDEQVQANRAVAAQQRATETIATEGGVAAATQQGQPPQ